MPKTSRTKSKSARAAKRSTRSNGGGARSRRPERSPAKLNGKLSAAVSDRHKLYEEAVQCPEAEIAFLDRVYKQRRGRKPQSLREDFCGTAYSSCSWVRLRPDNTATGVDLDGKVLNWARKNNLSWLTDEERERIQLLNENVLTAATPPVDVLVAMNFSYYLFMTRGELVEYFRRARAGLKPDGLFVCDCYGGYEAQDVIEETRKCAGFTYVWDQAHFNPITNETVCHIHFRFPDGSEMRKAFSYTWRLWSLPEIREAMDEAGFSKTTVYWEGTDPETDEGNGVFRATTKGEICAGWIAYIVADP